MPSIARKKNALSFTIGPPTVPPNCSRLKSVSGLPSDVFDGQRLEALEAERRCRAASFVPDFVMTLTTPPAVRPNSAFAPVATTWNSLHRVERDVDGRALAAHLLAEEAVVVVAAVEADVVEDAALAGERDLVAVRPLHDAHARA